MPPDGQKNRHWLLRTLSALAVVLFFVWQGHFDHPVVTIAVATVLTVVVMLTARHVSSRHFSLVSVVLVVGATVVVAGVAIPAYGGLKSCRGDRGGDEGMTSFFTVVDQAPAVALLDGSVAHFQADLHDGPFVQLVDGRAVPNSPDADPFTVVSYDACIDGRRCQDIVLAGWTKGLGVSTCSWWGRSHWLPLRGQGPGGSSCILALDLNARPSARLARQTGVNQSGTYYAVEPRTSSCSAGRAGRILTTPYGWHDTVTGTTKAALQSV